MREGSIGQVEDPEDMYYLMSRVLDKDDADRTWFPSRLSDVNPC